jgi:ABC-type oligopeptide transport system substrate-binding subunit
MKKIVAVYVLSLLFLSACGPKAYYKTSEGKKKQKYYNDIQYGKDANPKKKF